MTNYTNKMQQQVQEFHEVFEHPTTDKPSPMSLERANGRSQWGTGEELVEFIHASSSNQEEFKQSFAELLLGLRKAYEKQSSKDFPITEEERIIAQADAIADRLYFTFGDAVEIGVDMEPIMTLVHDANMSKLFTDEKGNKYVKYNKEGKVMKSPEFEAPEDKIKEEILNQLNPKHKKKSSRKGKVKSNKELEDKNIVFHDSLDFSKVDINNLESSSIILTGESIFAKELESGFAGVIEGGVIKSTDITLNEESSIKKSTSEVEDVTNWIED